MRKIEIEIEDINFLETYLRHAWTYMLEDSRKAITFIEEALDEIRRWKRGKGVVGVRIMEDKNE